MSAVTPLVFRREGLTVTVTPVGSQWAWRAEGAAPFVSGAFPHVQAALKNVFRSLPMLSALAGQDVGDLAGELRAAAREAGPVRPSLMSVRETAELAEIDALLDEMYAETLGGEVLPWHSHEGRVIVDLGTYRQRAGEDGAELDFPAARITVYSRLMGAGESHPFGSTTAALAGVRHWHAVAMGRDPGGSDPLAEKMKEDGPWI